MPQSLCEASLVKFKVSELKFGPTHLHYLLSQSDCQNNSFISRNKPILVSEGRNHHLKVIHG